MIKDLND